MTTFLEILQARLVNPASVNQLAVRRLLENVGDRSLAIVPDEGTVHEELKRCGHGGPVGLRVTFETADGEGGHEACACIAGLTLRQAGKLGKAYGSAVVFAGPETDGDVCVLPVGGGLKRFGPRDADGISRAYKAARGIAKVQFDSPPWTWIEAVMEDKWRADHA